MYNFNICIFLRDIYWNDSLDKQEQIFKTLRYIAKLPSKILIR